MGNQMGKWTHRLMTAGAVLVLGAPQEALATQHLVAPGDRWDLLTRKVKPGDEIILMPGTHRPANIFGLRGEQGKPIVIRGVNAENPATIEADRYGLRLHWPQHLRLENIVISGATLCGLILDDAPPEEKMTIAATVEEEYVPGSIKLNNVRVERTGPEGDRDAIMLIGVEDVDFEDCAVEGWAGTAVRIVGSRDVQFRSCRFIGFPDHSQDSLAQIGAGSESVRFSNCRFEHSLKQGIGFGAPMEAEQFRPPLPDKVRRASVFAARNMWVQQCIFVDCASPIQFGTIDSCAVRGNTFVRPRRFVFQVHSQTTDERFATPRGIRFSNNLIVWEPGDLERLCQVVGTHRDRVFQIGENLWWSAESEEDRAGLGELPGKQAWSQITDVDPALDENLRPTVMAAESFGAHIR